MIRMRGRLLLFDTLDKAGFLFPKDCELTYPEKVPVVMYFKFNDPTKIIGHAIVSKDEKGLICNIELDNFDRDILQHEFNDELYIGGYYRNTKRDIKDGVVVIKKATLIGISTVFAPAHEEMKIRVVEEE